MTAYNEQRWDECARLLSAKASLSSTDEKPSALWEVASCYALGGNQGAALDTLDEAIRLGLRDVLVVEDPDLVSLHHDSRWRAVSEGIQRNLVNYKLSIKEPELRERLLAREQSDQKLRKELLRQTSSSRVSQLTDELRYFDRSTALLMAVTLGLYGYPSKSKVGRDGSKAAWLLVQHCDQDPGLQGTALPQSEIASAIVAGGGDSILAVKGNQPTLHGEIVGHFLDPMEDDFARVEVSRHETKKNGHEREEHRTYYVVDVPVGLWPMRGAGRAWYRSAWPSARRCGTARPATTCGPSSSAGSCRPAGSGRW